MEKEYIVHGPKIQEDYGNVNIGLVLYNGLLKFKNQPVFIDGISGQTITAHDVLHTACCLAESLKEHGFTKKDVIGIVSENSVYFGIPLLAALFLGCTVTLYSPVYTAGELLYLTDISKPSVIFSSESSLATLLSIRKQVKYLSEIILMDTAQTINGIKTIRNYIPNHIWERVDPYNYHSAIVNTDHAHDVALILYSSGTTGLPKGVMLTHKNMNACFAMFSNPSYYVWKNEWEHATVVILPMVHIFGFAFYVINWLLGLTSVIFKKFEAALFLKAIQHYRVRRMTMVPSLGNLLIQVPTHGVDLSSVENILCGGASLPTDTANRLKQMFPSLKHLSQAYGMTENMVMTIDKINDNRAGSCGTVSPNMSGKVVDKDGKSLGPGCIGELYFKGTTTLKGYLNASDGTNITSVDKDGWFATGDAGYYDADGYFYIVDRIKELMKYKGHQVAPVELEGVLLSLAGVADAAVIGLPHPYYGELPCAIIVKKAGSGLTEQEVARYIEDKLSPHKWLRGGVKFVDEIPKSPTGKILRKPLREKYIPKAKL